MGNIVFSDKYEPLFDLLDSWDECERLESISERTEEEEKRLKYYQELKTVHTVCESGGRDSGKTFGQGMFNAVAVADHGHRILSTRYTLASTDNSIEKAQENRIEELGLLDEFVITNKKFEHISNGGKIDIVGQKTSSGNQSAKMKSLEGYSIFVTEEAEELPSFEEWEKVTRSIRAKDLQTLSVLVFNPPTKAHWIYEKLYKGIPDGFNGIKNGVLYIHTTYLDNGKENMSIVNWEKYEKKRAIYERLEALSTEERELCSKEDIDEWKDYKYTIVGGFRPVAEGVIYEKWRIGEFDTSLPFAFGLDFGSNDPDALVKVAVDISRKLIYMEECYFKNNTSFEGLKTILETICGFEQLIVADCAERRMIRDYWDYGLNIEPCRKGADSVRHGIKTLQGYTFVVTENSLNLQTALDNYHWHNSKAGIPAHEWSDLCDAVRYVSIELITGGGNSIVW